MILNYMRCGVSGGACQTDMARAGGVRGTFKYAFDYSFNGEHDGNKQKLKYAQTKIEIN